MRKLTTTLCLTIAVLLGSASMLVIPSTAEAGFLSVILKAIFGESDKVVKTMSDAPANLKVGGSNTTDGTVGKIESEGYSYTAQFGSRTLREQYRAKNKCPSNRWAISVFKNTNIYSEPKISSRIIGTLDKDEKVCVVKEEGEWAKTFYGWVEKHRLSWVANYHKGVTAYKNKDYDTALREWIPLAKQGIANAQSNLGYMYRKGLGVPQDDKTAVKWWKLAAKQGHTIAQSNLGLMYKKGRGVPQDDKIAVKWWKLAAEQGYASAQLKLGTMYYYGKGVIKEIVHGYMWMSIAASSGYKGAVKPRDILEKEMTPSQLVKAQKLARECVRKKYKGC